MEIFKFLYSKGADVNVVDDVSFHVNQGEIVGLLGPNGAGKTTSFYMITGMIKPTQGSIFLDESDITKKAMYQRSRYGIGYLPQDESIFRKLSVEDNLRLVLEMSQLSKAEQQHKIDELLSDLSINHIRSSFGGNLSGGERRLLEISRALVMKPQVLLVDEPSIGLEPRFIEMVFEILYDLQEKEGKTIIMVEQNAKKGLEFADIGYVLVAGELALAGKGNELLENPEVGRLFLGG